MLAYYFALYLSVILFPALPNIVKFSQNKYYSYTQPVPQFTLANVPSTVLLCSAPDDLMQVDNVLLFPDPPVRGTNLSVVVQGMLKADLLDGAYLLADVKKGIIKFPTVKFPICDYIPDGCPVLKDSTEIEMSFDIPKMVPGGPYEVRVVLYAADEKLSPGYASRILNRFSAEDNAQITVAGGRVACAEGSVEL